MRLLGVFLLGALAFAGPEPLTADAVIVREADLPKGFRLVEGIHCASPQAWSFYQSPDAGGFLPTPTRKMSQPIASDGGAWGSVFVFEYRDGVPDTLSAFLKGALYGDGGRSAKHPEELILHGTFAWIVSYPAGDPVAEWYKERLRSRFGVPAPRYRADLRALTTKVLAAYEARDADTGIRLLREDPKVLDGFAYGQYLLGDLLATKGDLAGSEKAYRRALELHESLEDPLAPERLWGALDGFGHTLLDLGKYAEAVKVLRRAVAAADETPDAMKNATRSGYYLAGALARAGSYAEAHEALKQVVTADPKYKKWARKSEHLAEAMKRKDFQDLVSD
ncbi:MAG: tetratricopeptide repeat protein [Planctomycetota bacterium]